MKKTPVIMIALMAFFSASLCAESEIKLESIAPYPAAESDQIRHAIFVSEQKKEDNLKVEIVMGKTMEIDCNRHRLNAKLDSKMLQGWGYRYFVLQDVSGPASTMKACLNQKKRDAFVTIPSATRLERYNSKLPIVIYTPKEIEVRYRIWTAEDDYKPAQEH